jgi:PKD repeat protein
MRKLLILSICIFSFFTSSSQLTKQEKSELSKKFETYSVQDFSINENLEKLRNTNKFHSIKLKNPDGGFWNLELTPTDLFSENFVARSVSTEGESRSNTPSAFPYNGTIEGINDSRVSLTISEDFISGYIRIGKEHYYYKNLGSYLPERNDEIIIYNVKDAIEEKPFYCGSTKDHIINDPGIKKESESLVVGECFEVEIAFADDFLMFDSYGSTGAVQSHNTAVLNDVQTNYDDEFADEVQFIISEFFIVTSDGADPWTSSNGAGTLLNSFTDWGPTGFIFPHDVASLWTDRDFNGGTVGIAWLGVVCTNNRYNCLQDYTNNSNSLRVLTAHELGHNFNAFHDAAGSGFIMAPSVNNTNSWSSNSVNSISSHIASRTCLTSCSPTGGGNAPVADFNFNIIGGGGCAPLTVDFFDQSIQNPTDWEWEFPGGSPSFSTDENPTVIYNNPGLFDVTLTVSNNNGSDTETLFDIIDVEAGPDVDFTFTVDGFNVDFENLSSNDVDSYLWDFGDGNSSTLENPFHTYDLDGFYSVTLLGFNDCGSTEHIEFVEIVTPPIVGFTSDITSGCAPLNVQFTNQSSENVENFFWAFEEGSPATSTVENPFITYEEPGVYDVELFVTNSAGESELVMEDFIIVSPQAVAEFIFDVDNNVVSFTNQSTNFNGVLWDFGDGETATQINPNHTYDQDGTYTVTLNVDNDCGSASVAYEVNISSMAQAIFTQDVTEGCAELEVTYDASNSNLADNYEWTFVGGIPSSSTEETVTVTYNDVGVYDVTLSVSNAVSSDMVVVTDAVAVNDAPVASFSADINGSEVQVIADTGITTGNTYSWDFGDGNNATGTTANNTYSEEDIYMIILTVENECGVDQQALEVNLFTEPEASFTSDVTGGCLPFTVVYQSTASDNVEDYMWLFPGGVPTMSSEANPTVTYEEEGAYSATLIVSNPAGEDQETIENYITVSNVPEVSFSAVNNLTSVVFTNTSEDADSFSWDFGDGNSSIEENPTHVYDAEGSYTVILTATNDCGDNTFALEVNANELPSAGFTISVNEGCAPLEVQYENMSSDNVTAWAWEFPGGTPSTSSEPSPTVTYNTSGTYDATLVVTSDSGTDELTISEAINILGGPEIDISSLTVQNMVGFDSGVSDAVSYTWDFGDGMSSTEAMPSHIYAENGSYLVTLVVTDDCGSSTETLEITIDVYPEASFTSDANEGCAPFTVNYTDMSNNVDDIFWTFPGGFPNSAENVNEVTVTYNAPGSYDVIHRVTNDLGEDINENLNYVNVLDVPVAAFTIDQQDNSVVLTNNSTGGDTFSWDFGDGSMSNDENPAYTYDIEGDYTITLTVTNACGTDTFIQDLNVISTSTADLPLVNNLMVLPNPNDGNFSINLSSEISQEVNISLYTIVGKKVFSSFRSLVVGDNSLAISIDNPQQGAYMLLIESEKGRKVQKILMK